jgi:hypothetical protein
MKQPTRRSGTGEPPTQNQPAAPQVPPALGVEILNELIARAEQLDAQASLDSSDIQAFNQLARPQMARALGEKSESIDAVLHTSAGGFWMGMTEAEYDREYRGQVNNKIKLLRSCVQHLQMEIAMAPRVAAQSSRAPSAGRSATEVLERLADRFHLVARQLRNRQRGREPFTVKDEYDVQDLLHALLRVEFDDVRPEENTPSYAGGSSRMDFLLRDEEIVVEAKCTRDGLDAKKVGEQLLIDIAKYREHPHCKKLFCFVYDPEGRLENPSGLEADLSREWDGLPTRVLVRP